MLCNMPTYVLVPESFVHNPKLLSLLCYFGPTHCFSLEALNSQIEKGRSPKIFARFARKLQHLPPLNPGYATGSCELAHPVKAESHLSPRDPEKCSCSVPRALSKS